MPKCSFFNNLGEKINLAPSNQIADSKANTNSLQSKVSTIDQIMYYDQLTSSFVVSILGGMQKILNWNYSSINLTISLLPSLITLLNAILKQQVTEATSQLSGIPSYKLGAHIGSNSNQQQLQNTSTNLEQVNEDSALLSLTTNTNTNTNPDVTRINEAMFYLQLISSFLVLAATTVKANYFNSGSDRDKEFGMGLDLFIWGFPVFITFLNTILKSVRDNSIEQISSNPPTMNLNR